MSAEVVAVADGHPDAGLGHLARTSALAAALGCRGFRVSCHALGAEDPVEIDRIAWEPLRSLEEVPSPPVDGVLLLDSYRVDVAELGATPALTVVLHDGGDVPTQADVVIAPAVPVPENGFHALTGLVHAPLRVPFWGLSPRRIDDPATRVLVSTGGSDPRGLASELAATIGDALPDAEITLVRGPAAAPVRMPGVAVVEAPACLVDELLRADIVVCGAGQTMLEAAATGTPCVAIPLADNQGPNAATLEELGAVLVTRSVGSLGTALRHLSAQPEARRHMSRRAQGAVDGYGALRVAFELERVMAHRAGTAPAGVSAGNGV